MQKQDNSKRKSLSAYERKRKLYQILTVVVSLAIIFVWVVTMVMK